jgi:hypothetical protein
MASIVITSSAGDSIATNLIGYNQRPPRAVSTDKLASILYFKFLIKN